MRKILLTLTIFFIASPAFAFQSTKAKQVIIIDFETKQVLLAKNETVKMPTSSMSKAMTSYMVFQAIKDGRISMDTEFKVSEKAWEKGGSKMFVPQGGNVKVEDLLRGVIIQSGNDATIVLAEGLEGDETSFARKMTAQALELGMEDSNFANASGWPDPNHYSTAKDLALMAQHIISDFPEYYKLFSETEFTFSNIKQQNRNPLLYRNIGADGLKTGHTEAAGYGLIGTAQKDGRRVLMVVNGLESEKDRADESVRLIEWGLNNFKNITPIKKGDIIAKADIAMGKEKTVPLLIDEDIKITVPKEPKDSYSVQIKYNAPLIAPIQAGQEVGTLEVIIPNSQNLTYPLKTARSVEKLGFFKGTIEKIKRYVRGSI